MKDFSGIPASPGIAIGKALIYREDDLPEIPRYNIKENEIGQEWERLVKATDKLKEEISAFYENPNRQISREQEGIFQAHMLILEDPEMSEMIKVSLKNELQNIEWIVNKMYSEFGEKLMTSPVPLFRERATEITDISKHLIRFLLGIQSSIFSFVDPPEDVIIAARDLMPSAMMKICTPHVKGIAMDGGSKTCHMAILARAFNIPAVLGLSSFFRDVKDGELLIVDGSAGAVIKNPARVVLAKHEKEAEKYRTMIGKLPELSDLPAETTDGHRVALKANIEFPEEAANVLQYGAEGIGLYRSEFLFISSDSFSDETTQYDAYCSVLKIMGTKPVTIRTVDLGGDKVMPELLRVDEKNPLLGWRAIRLSLSNPELFKVQLRAILRASVHGNARIMFPMISGIEELNQALDILGEARDECRKLNQPFRENIEVGVMIEVPSAAITADILAESSSFFSIGTNDLVQYIMAVDRGNEKVSYLNDVNHPAILRMIKNSIDAAHAKGIPVAMCGELAGDPEATALLLGLGLDEFSMTASSIPRVKKVIRSISIESCKALAAECLSCRSSVEIHCAINKWKAYGSNSGKK